MGFGNNREFVHNGTAFTQTGAIDMGNQVISNIGAAGTDFSASGGLILAAPLILPIGTVAAPSIPTASGTDSGLVILSGEEAQWSQNGGASFSMAGAGLRMYDDRDLFFGSGEDVAFQYDTANNPDTLVTGLSTDSEGWIICQKGDMATNFAHADQTNPTIWLHSANAADTAEWLSFAHNQTDSVINSGQGGIQLNPTGNAANGETFFVKAASTTLTGMSGGTVTATNFLPAGSVILGFSLRVTTTITGCTSFQIGDGTDVDRFGNAIALTANTTTDNTSWTITSAPIYNAATSIVLTAVGGGASFTAGAVRMTVHYFGNSAPTA